MYVVGVKKVMFISNTTFSFSSDDILDLLHYCLSKSKSNSISLNDVSLKDEKLTASGNFYTKILWIKKTFSFKVALSNFFTDCNHIASTIEFLEPTALKKGKFIQKKVIKKLQNVISKISFLELNESIFLIKLEQLAGFIKALTIHLDDAYISTDEKLVIELRNTEVKLDELVQKKQSNPLLLEEGKEVVLFESKD